MRFWSIGVLAIALVFAASTTARASLTSTAQMQCAGQPYTDTVTINSNTTILTEGSSISGSFTSTVTNPCLGSPNVDSFHGGWGYGWTLTITDSSGTHTCGPVSFPFENDQTLCPVYGTSGNFSATFTLTPPPQGYSSYQIPPFEAGVRAGVGPAGFALTWVRDNSADLGGATPRSGCEGQCGFPINLVTGNTWMQRQDYAIPGIGGGLQVLRTWNSMWGVNSPFKQSGMFGDSWWSNYEEHIQTTSPGATYWRSDGSAFEFLYDKHSKTYSLTSPPDERASLIFNSRTALFTLTLRDGSQRIFNSGG